MCFRDPTFRRIRGLERRKNSRNRSYGHEFREKTTINFFILNNPACSNLPHNWSASLSFFPFFVGYDVRLNRRSEIACDNIVWTTATFQILLMGYFFAAT